MQTIGIHKHSLQVSSVDPSQAIMFSPVNLLSYVGEAEAANLTGNVVRANNFAIILIRR